MHYRTLCITGMVVTLSFGLGWSTVLIYGFFLAAWGRLALAPR